MDSISYNSRAVPHPAITMSRARAEAWTKQATDKDFYEYLKRLAIIYGKRHRINESSTIDETLLFRDFKKDKDSI